MDHVSHVHLTIVAELISLLFALMWPDKKTEAVFLQQRLGNVRPKVRASTTKRVRTAAILISRVTPKDIDNLYHTNYDHCSKMLYSIKIKKSISSWINYLELSITRTFLIFPGFPGQWKPCMIQVNFIFFSYLVLDLWFLSTNPKHHAFIIHKQLFLWKFNRLVQKSQNSFKWLFWQTESYYVLEL